MKQKKIEGIVLKSTPIFERDKRIELLTKTEGKKTILAKYANTKSFKFGSKLDVTQHIQCQLYTGKTFDILIECDLITSFPEIRTQFNAISFALYAIDLIQKITIEHQPTPELFQLLQNTFSRLNEKKESVISLKNTFHHTLLEIEGLITEDHPPVTDTEFKRYFEAYGNRTVKHCIWI